MAARSCGRTALTSRRKRSTTSQAERHHPSNVSNQRRYAGVPSRNDAFAHAFATEALSGCARFAAFAVTALFATGAIVALAQPRAPERVSLDALLTRAAWYLDYFVDQFENVVAEEICIQDASVMMPSFHPDGGSRRHRRADVGGGNVARASSRFAIRLPARQVTELRRSGLPACRGSAMNAYCS